MNLYGEHAHSIIREFENAWLQGSSPELKNYEARIPPKERLQVLVELIAIDLEHRWKSQAQSSIRSLTTRTILLEDYLRDFPMIAESQSYVKELLGEEYRARKLWGDKPSHCEYLTRFPEFGDDVRLCLQTIDQEIMRETGFHSPRETLSLRGETIDSVLVTNDVKRYEYAEFVLREMIGAGGLGKVYRAAMKETKRDVAVKFLKKQFYEHYESVASFLNEVLTVAKISHPGIVRIYGFGKTRLGAHFLVMDLVEGQNLSEYSKAFKFLSIKESLKLILQVLETLEYVHRQGVIHCDLKPANILINRQGQASITDFGFARSKETQGFSIGANAGTLISMAPEQANSCWGELSEKTDIFGIGAVLYELLSGTPPRSSDDFSDLLVDVIRGKQIEPLSKYREDISFEVETLCMKCLNSDPKERFASISELKKEIIEMIPFL